MEVLRSVGITSPYKRSAVATDSNLNVLRSLPSETSSATRVDPQTCALKSTAKTSHLKSTMKQEIFELGQAIRQQLQALFNEHPNIGDQWSLGDRCSPKDIQQSREIKAFLLEGDHQLRNEQFPLGWLKSIEAAFTGFASFWYVGHCKYDSDFRIEELEKTLSSLVDDLLFHSENFDNALGYSSDHTQHVVADFYEAKAKIKSRRLPEKFEAEAGATCLSALDNAITASQQALQTSKNPLSNSGNSKHYYERTEFKLIRRYMAKSFLLLDKKIIGDYPSITVKKQATLKPMVEAQRLFTLFYQKNYKDLSYNEQIELDLLKIDLQLKLSFLSNQSKKRPTLDKKTMRQLDRMYENVKTRLELCRPVERKWRYEATLIYIHAEMANRKPIFPADFLCCLGGSLSDKYHVIEAARMHKALDKHIEKAKEHCIRIELHRLPRSEKVFGQESESSLILLKRIGDMSSARVSLPPFIHHPNYEAGMSSRYEPRPMALDHCDFSPSYHEKYLFNSFVSKDFLERFDAG